MEDIELRILKVKKADWIDRLPKLKGIGRKQALATIRNYDRKIRRLENLK